MGQNISYKTNWSSASQEIPRIFMEREDSLPHPQQPATCRYPKLLA